MMYNYCAACKSIILFKTFFELYLKKIIESTNRILYVYVEKAISLILSNIRYYILYSSYFLHTRI